MRSLPSWTFALAGLAAGAATVALLPPSAIFHAAAGHDHAAAAPVAGERWACPMMDYVGDKPGKCPVCGMTLVKVVAGELNDAQVERLGLQTSVVAEGPAVALVRAYGAVRYDDRNARAVIARVPGRVVRRHAYGLHPGTVVKAGEPLVDLYSPEAYAAQGELAAAVKLGEPAAVRALVERFERWNLRPVADAVVAGAAPADTVTIRSPFDGLILGAEGADMAGAAPAVGQEIMADTPLVRLIDPRAFMVVVHVPETRANWLRAGQPARLASDDAGELADVSATVSWIAPELNLEIRAREIHLHIRDDANHLQAGSLVNARIRVALDSDLKPADPASPGRFALVPKTAVLSTGVRNVAWKIAGRDDSGRTRFELAPLALGPRLEDENGNDLYVVRAGLKPGDEVVTQGAFLVDSQAQLAGTPSLLFPQGATAPAPAHAH